MELLTRFQNLFFPINKSEFPFFGLLDKLVRKTIILTVLTVILNISILVAEEFGIPKRNPSFTPSSYSTSTSPSSASSGLSPLAVVARPAGKVGFQVSAPRETSATPALAQFPNVIRLVAFDQSGQSFGSGSYIGNYSDYGLILSNWHVIYGADGLVHIHFPNGFSSYGAVVLSDQKWDLALIVISRPPGSVPLLPISQTTPKPGDPLWIAGYGSGSYRLAGGRCVRYLAPEIPSDGSAPQYEIIDLSVSARQGDSGGPILNSKGELAGVLFGSDMVRSTAGSYCERVNRFLNQTRSTMESLPSRPEVYFASIEQGGPRHLLSESLNSAVSAEQPTVSSSQQRRADLAGSSTSFGTHSGSRRYMQSVPPASFSVFEKKVEKIQSSQPQQTEPDKTGDSPTVPEIPLTPFSFDSNRKKSHAVRTAAWMDMDLSTGFRYGSIGVGSDSSQHSSEATPIVQVGHQISDDTVTHISSEKQELTEENNAQPVSVPAMETNIPVSETKATVEEEEIPL
ncbi:MAG: serine protease, partial [Planctomycetaceae bacterium]|nr:serine protease [Planctomycetaceae bacterium]